MKDFPSMPRIIFTVLFSPSLFFKGLKCVGVILSKFFFFQYKAALFPKKIPVSRVDHPLDDLIPFNPGFVGIYLDFVAFWIRVVGLLCRYKKKGRMLAGQFISSITRLYNFAFKIYAKNLSTTNRPNYKETFRFKVIHLFDPHLMCIPSLHVMIVIHTYTALRHYARELEQEEALNDTIEKVYSGAVAITEAILYIKQHSVNCVAAALYAMRCFDPSLFDSQDARHFVHRLFELAPKDIPPEYAPFYAGTLVNPDDIPKFEEQIMSLYSYFIEAETTDWTEPVLKFLAAQPQYTGAEYI